MEPTFKLTSNDHEAIRVASAVARRILTCRTLSPEQIITIGRALRALNRLPRQTLGTDFEFGVEYRVSNDELSEMKYCTFRITESEFEISLGGSINVGYGHDSYSEPGWRFTNYDDASRDAEIFDIEERVNEYLNLGASVIVTDEGSDEIDDDAQDFPL